VVGRHPVSAPVAGAGRGPARRGTRAARTYRRSDSSASRAAGATRPATDESSYTRQIHDLTETLGRAAFASAWQAGADRSDDTAADEEDN
jgi:hypothetical protein